MNIIINNLDDVKENCISEIKRVLRTITDDYLDAALLRSVNKYRNTGKFQSALEYMESTPYYNTHKSAYVFTMPMAIVLDETNTMSKRLMNNLLTVNSTLEEDEDGIKHIRHEVYIERLNTRSLDTLVKYVKCMCKFVDPRKKRMHTLESFKEKFKIGSIVSIGGGLAKTYYIITSEPYLDKTNGDIKIGTQILNGYGEPNGRPFDRLAEGFNAVKKEDYIEVIKTKCNRDIEKNKKLMKKCDVEIKRITKLLEKQKSFIMSEKVI